MMTKTILAAALGLLVITPVIAADADVPELPPLTDQQLIDMLPTDSALEVRLNADFNADTIIDTAYIGGTEEKRVLKVMLGYKGEVDMGYEPAGEVEFENYPLGLAKLSAKKGVLVVEDLTGGTTATSATYRYRYDAKAGNMRLIGLDAQRYSRTNAHDSFKISWNLLSGTFISQRGHVNEKAGDKEEAYRYDPERKSERKSPPILLDNTPRPDELIDGSSAEK